MIFRTLGLIFNVVSWNITFRPLYPSAFFWCPLFIWAWKWDSTWEIIQGVQEIQTGNTKVLLFYVWFFGLLSSSLLSLVETQLFDHCILLPSSGIPCLSGHGNEIQPGKSFKVFKKFRQVILKYCYFMCDFSDSSPHLYCR